MKKNKIFHLILAIIGFALIVAGLSLVLVGSFLNDYLYIYISFAPLIIGVGVLTYILLYVVIKFLKARK